MVIMGVNLHQGTQSMICSEKKILTFGENKRWIKGATLKMKFFLIYKKYQLSCIILQFTNAAAIENSSLLATPWNSHALTLKLRNLYEKYLTFWYQNSIMIVYAKYSRTPL